jgi:chromosome segregation ATPase
MATSMLPVENHCAKCNKKNVIAKCEGCLQEFCHNDFENHRKELDQKLDYIEANRDLLQQVLIQQITEPHKHPLMQQVDQWEQETINKVKKIAEETRKRLLNYTNRHTSTIKLELDSLTDRLKQSRQEIDFMETNLNEWNQQLIRLEEELNKPSDVKIGYDSTPFITKIYVDISGKLN